MNLRPAILSNLKWEEVGVWNSQRPENNGLDIRDIVWPGHSHGPPKVYYCSTILLPMYLWKHLIPDQTYPWSHRFVPDIKQTKDS